MKSDSLLFLKSDKTPPPTKPGIIIRSPSEAGYKAASGAWVHGCLAIPKAEAADESDIHKWVQGLHLLAVSQDNQSSYLKNLADGRILFAEESFPYALKSGEEVLCVAFNVPVMEYLKLPKRPASYFIFGTSLRFKSNIITFNFA